MPATPHARASVPTPSGPAEAERIRLVHPRHAVDVDRDGRRRRRRRRSSRSCSRRRRADPRRRPRRAAFWMPVLGDRLHLDVGQHRARVDLDLWPGREHPTVAGDQHRRRLLERELHRGEAAEFGVRDDHVVGTGRVGVAAGSGIDRWRPAARRRVGRPATTARRRCRTRSCDEGEAERAARTSMPMTWARRRFFTRSLDVRPRQHGSTHRARPRYRRRP